MLVDCLTLWLSNAMLAGRPVEDDDRYAVRGVALGRRARWCWSPTRSAWAWCPKPPLGREFRDAAGRLNQEVAALADRVVFVAAGLPLVLKEA